MDSVKVSRRDIAYALNKASSSSRNGVVGGTTVAATMYLANMANIEVFATGGIGGVHRGADKSFDISADLIELASTPVTVVCAGVKSILDIPKTVEFMETHSVNCIVYGSRNSFPGFFTRETAMRGQFNTEDLAEVAEVIEKSKELGLRAGTVLACPIPEEFQGDGNLIEEALQKALKEAKEKGIRSKDVTPFILAYVNKMTSGASMKTNIALLKNNAKIGGQLANILAKSKHPSRIRAKSHGEQQSKPVDRPKIVVIGATIVDFEYVTAEDVKNDGASYVGKVTQRCGGVGRNHADALTRLGCDASFVSMIGNDENGKYFLDQCSHIDHSRVEVVKDLPTAAYMSLNVRGEVRFGISSIGEIVNRITPEVIQRNEDVISKADFVLFDGNIPTNTIGKIVDLTSFYKTKAWFEPTDLFKARKIFDCGRIDKIQFMSPNANEFLQLVERSGLRIEHLRKPWLLLTVRHIRQALGLYEAQRERVIKRE
ncbi:indigoidine synthase A-like protein [Ancylostoma duodenale]|uniref:Indigoidine synthase A-like protein n=1 Tax=Ancylostoma duodenale TaxID=51022 RepID=A0A0C2CAW1_9BILA|nr:indigoidine synthase A-like protein [Ancylostoma duodenale]